MGEATTLAGSELTAGRHLATPDAAAYLGVSIHALKRWRVLGIGPPYRVIGRRAVRYALEELEAFARAGLRTSTSDSDRRTT